MEPLLHHGDLAVVYTSSEYHVGDVVAYRNPDVREVVLHRIVALDGDRFVLQGDNNTWLDSYRPEGSRILGAMAFHVPEVGKRLGAVRTPWGMSAMVSVAALALFGGRRRLRRGEGNGAPAHDDAPAMRARNGHSPGPPRRPMTLPAAMVPALAGVAILSLAMSALLLATSSTVAAEHDVIYNQDGAFSYTGPVAPVGRAVYGREVLQTGDPAYLELTRSMTVSFDYTLSSPSVLQASGTIGLVAEVSDVNGWTRTIELAPTASFDGPAGTVEGVLDLRLLRSMTKQLERVTGVERDHYTLTVRPDVAIEGTLAGRPLSETFAPELRFFLDELQLQLEPPGSAPLGEEVVDPVHPGSGGLLKTTTREPRTFSFLGFDLGIVPLRAVALIVLLLSAGGLAAIFLVRRISARSGEAAAIEARYGQFLVPVHAGAPAPRGRMVQVESFDSLLRLANHYGHVVLHEEGDGFHAYSIEENGVTYRYLVANGTHQ
jgi:hypothetical protein